MRLLFSVPLLLTVLSSSARAQRNPLSQTQSPLAKALETNRVYTCVEQMPELPGGGGNAALVAAINKRLNVPHLKPQPDWPRTVIYFIVGPSGAIYGEQIIVSSRVPAYDKALLKAVRTLPRLTPGYQSGKPVAVSFTMPIRIELQ
ncbi:energy transducer TonB [Hymenobacter sp. BT664]|uniref:Energy transducer TonB n=1 Tax=Hymenobacter montanus TaxID=2771359 RepID=A0A927BF22_9BACT|nr:energy transducer TonB [Hymenobacter montanus]